MVGRYLPNLFITLELAALAMLVDLVFGVPVRLHPGPQGALPGRSCAAFMVFPMFGALYIAFGLRLHPAARRSGDPAARRRSASPSTPGALQPAVDRRLRDGHLHLPVHGHERRHGAEQRRSRRSRRRRPASGARPWQTFRRILIPLTRAGIVAGHADGLRLEHRRVRRAAAARIGPRAAGAGADALPARRRPERLRRCRRPWASSCWSSPSSCPTCSLRYSRGALVD